ncbi:MAG: amidase [bacterium]
MTTVAPAYDLSASDLATRIASRTCTPTEAVSSALLRIDELEDRVHAWAFVDRETALAQAEVLTSEAANGDLRGPLHGVPVGIKDVFHVQAMPTVANSKTMDPSAAYGDSAVAAALRAAGAIILGKCETVEFAGMGMPPPTRNPWNLEHTAGGSSSGSGAAVGARMVPVAIGTQTGGSNLRPAAYNGIAGFKPSHGAISREGLLPVSWTLDHPGIIARTAVDLSLVFDAIARARPVSPLRTGPWRIGLVREFFLERSEQPVVESVERAVSLMRDGGATVAEAHLPPIFAAQQAIHRLIMSPEMVTYHATRLAEQEDRMTPRHVQSVKAFSLLPVTYYIQALRARRILKEQLALLFDQFDILVMPTTPAPAPKGLDSTGDASLLSPWSLVGFPAATVPCGLSNGLPLGLQLVGKPGSDTTVLAAAEFAESVLGLLDLPF